MMTSYYDVWTHITLLIVWIGYAITEGHQEGYFYYYRNIASPSKKQNLHWMPFLERGIVLAMIAYCNYTEDGTLFPMLKDGVFVFSLILIFSFYHNGMYYATRHKLDPKIYPNKWWSTSTTSEANLEFNCTSRVVMSLIGMLGVVASLSL